jgi:hypothetical protein
LGATSWWWLSLALTTLFAWWLRKFFSGSSRFWQLGVFGLISLLVFLLLLLLPYLLHMMAPKINWPMITWGSEWWLYFLVHLVFLFIGYLLISFSHEK